MGRSDQCKITFLGLSCPASGGEGTQMVTDKTEENWPKHHSACLCEGIPTTVAFPATYFLTADQNLFGIAHYSYNTTLFSV